MNKIKISLKESEESTEIINDFGEDSNGNKLTKEQFEYFKGSKIRNNQNKLLVCYHGTDSEKEYKTLDPSKSSYGGNLAPATFFSDSKDFVISFASRFGNRGKVYECYINIINPLIINANGNDFYSIPLEGKEVHISEVIAHAIKQNYDGVIINNVSEYQGTHIVTDIITFKMNQIKLISNKTPTNSDIMSECIKIKESYSSMAIEKIYESQKIKIFGAAKTNKNDTPLNLTEDDIHGDIYSIVLTRKDDNEKEVIELNDVYLAQEYIDKIKLDNDEFFSEAVLVDEHGNVLDKWSYVEEQCRSKNNSKNKKSVVNEEADASSNDSKLDSAISDAACAAICVANDFKYIHWHCKGNLFDTAHNISSDYYSKASDDADLLAELALELGSNIPNPSLMADIINWTPVKAEDLNNISFDTFLDCSQDIINKYLNALKFIYEIPGVTSDITSEIDSIVRYWSKERNYKNVRRAE